MNEKTKPSKIPTTGKNTNKKKVGGGAAKPFDKAFFKKNEFALILLGASLLTVIIFFVFFRSSQEPAPSGAAQSKAAASFESLESRVAGLEATLQSPDKNANPGNTPNAADLVDLTNRVTRLEAAFQLKVDSLIERMGSLENKIASAPAVTPIAPKPLQSVAEQKSAPAQKAPVKKAVKKENKAPIFHTVTKGETLYSISKKYKTTVPVLRKLNNLSEKDKIFPGNNIIVR
jgi:LysM repeat protein